MYKPERDSSRRGIQQASTPQNGRKPPKPAKQASRRERQRYRLLNSNPHLLAEVEVLEMLLWLGEARSDMRPLATRILQLFGSIAEAQKVSYQNLSTLDGWRSEAYVGLKLALVAESRLILPRLMEKPILSGWPSLMTHLRAHDVGQKEGHLRVLFLNQKNRLLAESSQLFLRTEAGEKITKQLASKALDVKAAAVILVTVAERQIKELNPSPAEISLTLQVQSVMEALSITLHDHVVLSDTKSEAFSFRNAGLL